MATVRPQLERVYINLGMRHVRAGISTGHGPPLPRNGRFFCRLRAMVINIPAENMFTNNIFSWNVCARDLAV